MLNRLDDYPIHQTPEPIAVPATSDRNVYDRTWFNGYSPDGSQYFGVGMAVYPHREILDGAFSTVERRRTSACVLRLTARTARTDRHAGRSVPDRDRRAAATDTSDPRRQRIGHRLRPHVLGPHRADRGGPSDTVGRPSSLDGRHPVRSVRPLDRHRATPRRRVHRRGAGTARRIARGACDPSANARPAAHPDDPSGIFFLWAPLIWDDHVSHAIFFDGPER